MGENHKGMVFFIIPVFQYSIIPVSGLLFFH